jgi:hypothetical protein
VIIIAVVLVRVGPNIVNQGRKFSTDLPGIIDRFASGNIVWQIGLREG